MIRKKLRKLILNIHLWLGVSSAIILVIVCLTGTIYTFRAEVERWVDSEKYYSPDKTASPLPADQLLQTVGNRLEGRVTGFSIPSEQGMNWQVSVKKNADTSKDARPVTYFIDPATGEVRGEQGGSTSEFFSTIMKLHRWLLLGDSTGRIIVGVATVIFVWIILSGIILWFPSKLKNIRRGLTVKLYANWKRINHDLHYAIGIYSSVFLLIMALTGLCWSFEWYRDGLSQVLGTRVFKGRTEKPVMTAVPDSARTILYEPMVSLMDSTFDYRGNLRISIPDNDSAAISITKYATGFFAVAGVDRLLVDRYTGTVLRKEAFADKAFNDQIADSIKIIHTGEIFGTFSKLLYFLICLFASSLPVTGVLMWLNKFR